MNRYSFQNYDEKNMVSVVGRSLPVSFKYCYEIANFIKGKKIDFAIQYLKKVLDKKVSIPFKRFVRDTAHKPGGQVGKYPYNASKEVIALLESLKSNAQAKGLDTTKLVAIHAAAQKGALLRHQTLRKKSGKVRKNTHFELIAKEVEEKEKKKYTKEEVRK